MEQIYNIFDVYAYYDDVQPVVINDKIREIEDELLEVGYKKGTFTFRSMIYLGLMLPGKKARKVRDTLLEAERNRPRSVREEDLVQSGIDKNLAMLLFPELFIEEK